MVPFLDDLDVDKLHVQAPTEIIFLCGGRYDMKAANALSMRDAFLKCASHPAVGDRDVVLAEDFTKLSVFAAYYDDILEFETDLAQITEMIVLFCESAGSFTELGSFASIGEISKRLLVFIRDFHWKEDSFIKLGPLRFLIKRNEQSVFVIEDRLIGLTDEGLSGFDIDAFKGVLDEPLRLRLNTAKEPSTFNRTRAGHLIKMIVGLVQEYGALEFNEIREAFDALGIEIEERRIRVYLLCAYTVGWLTENKRGFRDFITAQVDTPAIHFVSKSGPGTKNRSRRRLLIREHWAKFDGARLRAIAPQADL